MTDQGRLVRADVEANGVAFAVLSCGPDDGPLAVCLHGFPDAAPTWRHLLPALASAGYRAVAPWMRGYAPTAVPADGRYQAGALVADANALHDRLGGDDRAVVIGHDWGAMAAYGAASFAPDRWRAVVSMAVPPLSAVGMGLFTYDQLRRSWYMFFFQNALAEMAVSADDLAFIDRLWADWSPGYNAASDVPAVKDALRGPDNLSAALGYYRAMFGSAEPDPTLAGEQAAVAQIPSQPLLYLHGDRDGCLGLEIAEPTRGLLPVGSTMEVVEGAGHFLHVEQPDRVNRIVLDFLATASNPAG